MRLFDERRRKHYFLLILCTLFLIATIVSLSITLPIAVPHSPSLNTTLTTSGPVTTTGSATTTSDIASTSVSASTANAYATSTGAAASTTLGGATATLSDGLSTTAGSTSATLVSSTRAAAISTAITLLTSTGAVASTTDHGITSTTLGSSTLGESTTAERSTSIGASTSTTGQALTSTTLGSSTLGTSTTDARSTTGTTSAFASTNAVSSTDIGSTTVTTLASSTDIGSTTATTAVSSTGTTQAASLAAGGTAAASTFAASTSLAGSTSTTGTTSAAFASTSGTTTAASTSGTTIASTSTTLTSSTAAASSTAFGASTSTTGGASTSGTTLASSTAATSTTATTGFNPSTLDVYADAVSGNDANSGRSFSSPVQTITQALSIVASAGYQASCTIHLAAGTYPTPNGTLFNGTPYGTHTGPIVISGTTNSTAVWCDNVASTPTITAPNPLYSFTTIKTIPMLWSAAYAGTVNYYGGFTFTPTNGPDQGVSYMIAYNSTSNQFYLAYDSTTGPAPQFIGGTAFCIYGAPETILTGSTDNAIWQSTNGFAHTLANVQVQAYSGGTGLLRWQGLNWALQNVWLTGLYAVSDSIQAGITVTASAGCVLSAGEVASETRQGLRLGIVPGADLSIAVPSTLTVSGSSTTATLGNSVYQSGAVVVGTAANASLAASFLWGNAALTASSATLSATTLFATTWTNGATVEHLAYSVSGGTTTMSSSYLLGPALTVPSGSAALTGVTITGGSASNTVLISGSGAATFTNVTMTGGAAVDGSSIYLTGGTGVVTNSAFTTVADHNYAISTSGGTLVISGSTFNGGNHLAHALAFGNGNIVVMAGTVVQNVGHGWNCLSHQGTGALMVNGSSVFRNCGTTTTDSAVSLVPTGSGGTVTMNNVIIGPNPGTGLLVGIGPSTGGSVTINTLASPAGQPNAKYAVQMSSAGSTLYEKTGTNAGFIGSVAQVHVCSTDYTWATLDSDGTTTVSVCTVHAD
jgi:hypothetical protein